MKVEIVYFVNRGYAVRLTKWYGRKVFLSVGREYTWTEKSEVFDWCIFETQAEAEMRALSFLDKGKVVKVIEND